MRGSMCMCVWMYVFVFYLCVCVCVCLGIFKVYLLDICVGVEARHSKFMTVCVQPGEHN